MDYYLLNFGDSEGYQEIDNNVLIRYCHLDGTDAPEFPLEGNGGVMVTTTPTRQVWMK